MRNWRPTPREAPRAWRLAPLLTAILCLAVEPPALASESSGTVDDFICTEAKAAEIFKTQTCTRCHAAANETGERTEVPAARTPPSAGALRRGSAPMAPERVTKLLEKRFDGRGMRHPIPWRGDESELACLVAWLSNDLERGSESAHRDRHEP